MPALLCFSASKFIHAYRWRLLLAETEEAPLPDLFAIYLVSNMANNAVPFRIGDVLRIQVPAQRFGIPRAELAAAVIVAETVLDGFTFLILTLVVLSFIHVAILPTGVALGLAAAITLAFVGVADRRARSAAAEPGRQAVDVGIHGADASQDCQSGAGVPRGAGRRCASRSERCA